MNPTPYIKNSRLESSETKNIILKYLYQRITPTNFDIIKNRAELDKIKNDKYIICPTFSGTRSYIIFFRTDNKYYAVTIPKNNRKNQDGMVIYPVQIDVCKEIYRGTIMEGIYYSIDYTKYLIIDEVYLLAGQDQTFKPKSDRLENLSRYITTAIRRNPYYQLYVNQFFHINKRDLETLYEKIKHTPKIQKIIFYPEVYGRKIYVYTIIEMDIVDNIVKLDEFYLQKTASPDVYNLLSISTKDKIDIAYIPDLETSRKCKQWFKGRGKELRIQCKMDMSRKKWIPLNLAQGAKKVVEV